jgi:hypothetical protein
MGINAMNPITADAFLIYCGGWIPDMKRKKTGFATKSDDQDLHIHISAAVGKSAFHAP